MSSSQPSNSSVSSSSPSSTWKGWFNQKFCEGLVLLDIVWYQVMHIPWFLRNELNLISHIDEYHDHDEKKNRLKYWLLKGFGQVVRKLKRFLYGKDHEKNFYLNYGIRYANQRRRQTVHEYIPFKPDQSNRVYIFLHGGTWHSGSADLYHRFASFVSGQKNHACYNLNYSLFPQVHLEEMIEDVDRGVNYVIERVNEKMDNPEIILVGHSAGAHLFSLISLNKIYNNFNFEKTNWKLEQVKKLVLLCGVYDMATHYEYEKTRKVHDISPMWKICKGTHRFPLFSPTLIIRSNNVANPESVSKWPSTSIAHGKKDVTCPWIQSQVFHQELSALCPNSVIQLHPLEQFFHGDLITNFMGIERDFDKRDQIWKIINSSLQ
ncbi:predicted protein [Naegleria gruberi]|uniref:Predicted protein n=1 Tax=Naegleria gruberi TaxID=5762 RepID=D2VQF7_NAEGR|nr:uncharacterized protein NAEGRDRAFT_71209 [Naegleria gruberi]EFC40938.1 predicted protein [Naegleria gruberi]|eukprot:XP_002673682.1 predicted protein [Naegleria gruberi strain NEG-M]